LQRNNFVAIYSLPHKNFIAIGPFAHEYSVRLNLLPRENFVVIGSFAMQIFR
jgi:hypothetical protein